MKHHETTNSPIPEPAAVSIPSVLFITMSAISPVERCCTFITGTCVWLWFETWRPLLTAVEKSLDTTGKDVHRCSSPQSTQYQSISYIYINIIYLDRPQLRTKQLSAPSQIGSLPYSGDFFSSPVLGLATAQCSIAMVTITKTTFFNGNEPIKSEQYSITHGYKMIHILIESCWFIYIDNISEATFTSQNLTGW